MLLSILMVVFCTTTMVGCDVALMDAFDKQLLQQENKELKEQIKALEKEIANLKFDVTFENGVVDKDCILNLVDRVVVGEGDALQVTNGAQVTINGGNFDGGSTPLGGVGNTTIWCNSENAKVIINDGKFTIDGLVEGDSGHIDLIYCSLGTIEINGGYFEGKDSTVWLVNCKDTNYKEGKANIIIKGGTFVNFNPADCISEGEHTNFVAEGYSVIKETIDGVDYYKVVEGVVEEPTINGGNNEF